ncbi:1-(5-phosphoribosyl)-5-[(5-phosphoribosylamino)methylideneamino]imidazole-4-carboxamide isomerase [Candidatus Caldatribacterium saccharofermentans]|uniref:1-(5-phosphoribosyl)-5-[(5-phosphoribosylamino)methylideneamino] imidazole-4-carboxamide isomerase n=1 Tax=Candidatus Caldatribacterium saccharofermentans TaxID=1454753 RepID=A0A7V4TFL6_9BACT
MLLIPAIDLFAGRVVRLTQGDYQRLEVYHDDPLIVAKQLEEEGAPMLHVVDLEGARAGEPRNFPSVASIVKSVRIPVQVGGGIRTLEVLRRYLDLGVAFPVVGSVVVKDPETFAEMLKVGGERLTVSLDVRDGVLAVSGWTEGTSLRASDLARELHERGVTRFILTDVTRDGTLEGVDGESIRRFIEDSGVSVIVAGGVRGIEDILLLQTIPGVSGVILGKVLYTGRVSFREILERAGGRQC